MRGIPRWPAALSAAVLFSCSFSALAQEPEKQVGSIALNSFQPAPAGDPFQGVQGPFIGGHLVLRGALTVDYADQPLAFAFGGERSTIVQQQTFLHVGASIAMEDRLLVSLAMPVAIDQGGGDPTVGVYRLQSPRGGAAGDLRLGAKVRIFGDELDPFQAGVGAYLHAPTGQSRSYVSDQSTRLQAQLLLGGRRGAFVWSFALGGDIRGNHNPSALTAGLALGWAFLGEKLQIQAEATSATLLQQGSFRLAELLDIPRDRGDTSVELLFGARWRATDDLLLGASLGPGLTNTFGTPAFRALGSVAWSPRGSADAHPELRQGADPDEDKVLGSEDRCPYESGPRSAKPGRNGCPRLDRDKDGIEDQEDACVDRAGDASADPKKNGCPVDRDDDGVADELDLCPDVSGIVEMNGCPADTDRDGVEDSADACPKKQGQKTEDPATNGCPAKAPP